MTAADAPQLEKPLRELAWMQAQRARNFERFGIVTIEDLLTHYRSGTRTGGRSTIFQIRKASSRCACAARCWASP